MGVGNNRKRKRKDNANGKPENKKPSAEKNISITTEKLESGSTSFSSIESLFSTKADGYQISKKARKKMRDNGQFSQTESLQYGEIDPASFHQLLVKVIKPQCNEVFLDIGSGLGKACFVAALLPFRKSRGIEILPCLHEVAIGALKKAALKGHHWSNKVDLVLGDSFEESWSNADVLFAPVTCFTEDMVNKACNRIKSQLKKGSRVISTTSKIPGLKLIDSRRLKIKKGSLMFYCFEKG